MAKNSKTPKQPKQQPAQPAAAATAPRQPHPIRITLRGSDPWLAAVDSLASALASQSGMARVDRTQLIDRALNDLAKKLKVKLPARY